MTRKYNCPEGGTSVSIGGETFDANKKGVVTVPDEANHGDLLSLGFTLAAGQDDPAAPVIANDTDAAALAAFNAAAAAAATPPAA